MKKVIVAALVSAALAAASPAHSENMNNTTVISMEKAGLSGGLIIDKINSEPCGYDVSTGSLISLKQGGVSDDIIAAMVRRCASLAEVRGVAGDDSSNDPKIRHSPGIYVAEPWLQSAPLQVLRPSKSSGIRTTGNGSIMLPLVAHMMVPGPNGHTAIMSDSPVFYFYFNVSDTAVSDFGTDHSLAAQSPDEFTLVRFKARGQDREIDLGKASAYEGSIVSMRKGINPKSTVRFDATDLGNGTYKVTPQSALEPGEYAFVTTGSNSTSRIYDFSVSGPSVAISSAK